MNITYSILHSVLGLVLLLLPSVGISGLTISVASEWRTQEGKPLLIPLNIKSTAGLPVHFSVEGLPAFASISSDPQQIAVLPQYGDGGFYPLKIVATEGFPVVLKTSRRTIKLRVAHRRSFVDWQSPNAYQNDSHSITFTPRERWGIFTQNEPIGVYTSGGQTVRVISPTNQTVYQGPGGLLPVLPWGHYFVESGSDRDQFVVLPSDFGYTSFHGQLGTELWGGPIGEQLLTSMRSNVVRLWAGCGWPNVQPQSGNDWLWANNERGGCDPTIEIARRNNQKILFVADGRPNWLVDDADFIPRYVEYIRQFILRYRSQIHSIEIWNEPFYNTYQYSKLPYGNTRETIAKGYMDVYKAAHAAIKELAPEILVIGPSWQDINSIWLTMTQEMVTHGASEVMEGFSYHDYDNYYESPDLDHPTSQRTDKKIQAIYQAFGRIIPLYIDEIGFFGDSALGSPRALTSGYNDTPSGLSWHAGMNRAVKTALMSLAEGAQLLLPHVQWFQTGTVEFSGRDTHQRGPHPRTSAYLMALHRLKNAVLYSKQIISDKVFIYTWAKPTGGSFAFAWSVPGHSARFKPYASLKPTDIYGNKLEVLEIEEEPIYFESTKSPDALAKVLRARINSVPYFLNPRITVLPSRPASFQLDLDDYDQDRILVKIVSMPAGMTYHSSTRNFNWSPTPEQVGLHSIKLKVLDRFGWAFIEKTIEVSSLKNDRAGILPLNQATGGVLSPLIGAEQVAQEGALTFWIKTNEIPNGNLRVATIRGSELNFVRLYLAAHFESYGNRIVAERFENGTVVSSVGGAGQYRNPIINTGNWRHIALSWKGTELKLFIDGVDASGGFALATTWGLAPEMSFTIGDQNIFGTGPTSIYDQASVFNRAISAQEIELLFNLGRTQAL